MANKVEINFTRLLNRCETMAGEKKQGEWRLEKYVGALQDMLVELRKGPSQPSQELLSDYTRKVEFLKGLIQTEKLPSASEKALAVERLAPASTSSVKATPSRELHLQHKARYQQQMRDELLGKPSLETDGGVRKRLPGGLVGGAQEDIDSVLKHHHHAQEKLAEEMVHLAKSLKENARAAGRIVQDDNKKLGSSHKLADTNIVKLKTESDRLEAHVQKSCNWWIWIMLALVTVTFVWMVLFMRVFPKKT